MAVEIQLDPQAADDLAKLARKLKTLGDGKAIPAQFRAALRRGATPAVRDAKAAARALPSKNQGKSHLRANIARATSAKVKTGGDPQVGVRISRKALGPQASLPRLLNRGGFTHQVFGHQPEVFQRGIIGWYDNVMRAASPGVRAELEKVCDEFERKLMR